MDKGTAIFCIPYLKFEFHPVTPISQTKKAPQLIKSGGTLLIDLFY